MKKIMKILFTLFMVVGMTAVGPVSNEITQPDTQDKDQRTPPPAASLAHESPKKGKNGGTSGPDKGHSRRRYRKNVERSPLEFRNQMKSGTWQQKKAWKKLRLPSPTQRMTESVKRIHQMRRQGRKTTAELFSDEISRIKSDAAIMKDPTYQLSYVNCCINNYHHALKATKRVKGFKNLDFADLTVTPDILVSALTDAFGEVEAPYKFSVRDHMVSHGKNKHPGTTAVIHRNFVRANNSILNLRVREIVNETADEDYKQFVASTVDLAALNEAAKNTLSTWIKEYQETGSTNPEIEDTKTFLELGAYIKVAKRGNVDPVTTLEIKENTGKLIRALVDKNSQNIKSKKDFVQDAIKAKAKELKKTIKPTQIIEMRRGNDVTIQWHLTPMSEWKKTAKNGVQENNHNGARFLFGPSNGVKIPNSVTDPDRKEGVSKLTGDAVSLQMLLSSSFKGGPMNEWGTVQKKQDNLQYYYMVQLAMSGDPRKASKVVGLYTNPDVVNDFDHEAPAVVSFIAKTPKPLPRKGKGKRGKGKKLGPNQRKNRKASAQKQAVKDSEEVKLSKEELAHYAPSKGTEDNGIADLIEKASSEPNTVFTNQHSDPYGNMTSRQLDDVCRTNAIKGFSSLKKVGKLELVRKYMFDAPLNSNVEPKKSKKKGKSPPKATRRRNAD